VGYEHAVGSANWLTADSGEGRSGKSLNPVNVFRDLIDDHVLSLPLNRMLDPMKS